MYLSIVPRQLPFGIVDGQRIVGPLGICTRLRPATSDKCHAVSLGQSLHCGLYRCVHLPKRFCEFSPLCFGTEEREVLGKYDEFCTGRLRALDPICTAPKVGRHVIATIELNGSNPNTSRHPETGV